MTRISQQALTRAISKVQAMNRQQNEQLAEELFARQPHLFGAVLVQSKLGGGRSQVR